MTIKFMSFHVPTDSDFLRAFAVVSIRHAHLDHMLRMTIKILADVTVDEAVLGTASLGSAALRKRVRKLARRELGDGAPFIRLEALLEQCRHASEKRNDLIHGLFGKELEGEAQVRNRHNEWRPMPTAQELDDLAGTLATLANEINEARLNGFLAHGLIERRHGTPPPSKPKPTWGKSRIGE